MTGSQAQMGQPVTILALVKDAKGVSRVEFWVNNTLEATIPSGSPEGQKEFLVQHSWIPNSNGPCTLALRGFNVTGKMSEPFEVTINVTGSAPTATATSVSVLEITPTTPLVIPTSTTYTLDAVTTSGEHIIRNVIVNVAGACAALPTSTTDLDAWKTMTTGLHETPKIDTGAFLTQVAKPKITPRSH